VSSPQDILALNFAALLLDSDDQDMILQVVKRLPDNSATETAFARLLNGPFGKVDFETPCGCPMIAGYKSAIEESIDVIQRRGHSYKSASEKGAVLDDRERIVEQLRLLLRQVLTYNQQTLQ
jgi:hypothetical protein